MAGTPTAVYWDSFVHPLFQNRPLYLAATRQGLCRISWPNEPFDAVSTWVKRQLPGCDLLHDPEQVAAYVRQLQEYCDGTRQAFTVPCDLHGTAFQTSVWQALTEIPYGETRSYADIAAAVGSPTAVRAVGAANGSNPVPMVVPCHRVIGKNGALTGFGGGLQVKEQLLQLEGFHEYRPTGHARFQF